MDQFWVILWGAVGTIVTGLVTWLTAYLVSLLNSKVKDQKLRTFLTKFTEIAMACVNTLTQTVVDDLKKQGKFDAEAAAKVKEDCVALIRGQLSNDMVVFIQDNFGDVTSYISTQVENLVHNLKR